MAQALILFDGYCVLCNGTAGFVARRDPAGRFRFAALQSVIGGELARRHGVEPDELSTFVLVENDTAFVRSTAALRILRRLRFPWPLLYGLIVVPRALRDAVYDWVGRNRYRWFGRRASCDISDERVKSRIITDDKNDY